MNCKFEINVGQEFKGVVVVSIEDRPKDRDTLRNWPMKTLGVFLVTSVVCAILYGFFTGDYTVIKGFAESGERVLALATKAMSGASK